jgi:hypothetical protein
MTGIPRWLRLACDAKGFLTDSNSTSAPSEQDGTANGTDDLPMKDADYLSTSANHMAIYS